MRRRLSARIVRGGTSYNVPVLPLLLPMAATRDISFDGSVWLNGFRGFLFGPAQPSSDDISVCSIKCMPSNTNFIQQQIDDMFIWMHYSNGNDRIANLAHDNKFLTEFKASICRNFIGERLDHASWLFDKGTVFVDIVTDGKSNSFAEGEISSIQILSRRYNNKMMQVMKITLDASEVFLDPTQEKCDELAVCLFRQIQRANIGYNNFARGGIYCIDGQYYDHQGIWRSGEIITFQPFVNDSGADALIDGLKKCMGILQQTKPDIYASSVKPLIGSPEKPDTLQMFAALVYLSPDKIKQASLDVYEYAFNIKRRQAALAVERRWQASVEQQQPRER